MLRDRREIAAIFVGGALGSAARVLVAQSLPAYGPQFPWATFAVNIAGCLLLGYLITRLQERLPVTAYRRPLIGTGFCGALTTFSTFQLELLHMIDHGAVLLASIYCAASLAAGFALWPLVDELTFEDGIVTSELVPPSRGLGTGGEPAPLELAQVRPRQLER